jgi:hypothetical protein
VEEDERDTPHTALRRQHQKLFGILRDQTNDSENLDENAAAMLRASLVFSSIFAAGIYYLLQIAPAESVASFDNPLTYAALLSGLCSVVSSVFAITHTKIESELNPSDIAKQASFGDRSLLVTAVQTYPEYIGRNEDRLDTDKLLLAVSQYTLVTAVLGVVGSLLYVAFDRDVTFVGIIVVTFTAGILIGIPLTLLAVSLLSENG